MTTRDCKPAQSSYRSIRKGNAAFTLVETMIGAMLLVLVFGSLMMAISYGFTLMRTSRESLRATQIILERMEGIRLYNWNQLVYSNMFSSTNIVYFYPPDSGQTNSGVAYTVTFDVTNVLLDPEPSYAANMRMVTVTADWNSYGTPHERSMSTFVSQNGIQNYVFTH